MKKKFFAVVLAATMAVSTFFTASAQSLTGTAWWDGKEVGYDYTLAGDGEISFDVECVSGDANQYAAFSIEVAGNTNAETPELGCITTGSDQNAWYFGMQGDAISGVVANGVSTVEVGTTYTISVVRTGQNIKISYLKPDGTIYAEYIANNTNFGNVISVHAIAQVGKYIVDAEEEILAGTGWWDNGKELGQNYELSGTGKIELYVTYQEAFGNEDGAFNVEVTDSDNKCITTGSLRDAWYALGAEGDQIQIVNGTGALEVGKTYRITVEHSDGNVIITYYNSDGTQYVSFTANNVNLVENVKVHVIAQLGTYKVTQVMTTETADASVYAQYKPNVDGTYTVRIVSEVAIADAAYAEYKQIGFRCSKLATQAGDNYLGVNIYKSIKANGQTVTAEDGKYFVILEIKNVTNTATLYVEPKYENTSNEIKSLGNEVTVNMAALIK